MRLRAAMHVGLCYLISTIILGAACVSAQETATNFTFPTDPAQWINAPPLTREMLAGKAVFMWFYEEQCPRCREKWPSLIEVAKKNEDNPIVFIAVNSGNSRSAVEQYIRDVKVPWPVIVDPNRQFEKLAGVDEISLQNIHLAKVLTAEGKLVDGEWFAVDLAVQKALTGAKWKIPPAGIVDQLRPAWRAIEFGNPSFAAPAIKKGLTSANTPLKQGAGILNDFVQTEMQSALAAVKQNVEAGKNWEAYRGYETLAKRFAGFELPAEVAAQRKELATSDAVKSQLAALKQLDAIKKAANLSTSFGKQRVTGLLERLIQNSPDTTAAEEAAELLKMVRSAN